MGAGCYQILDVGLCLETDRDEVLDRFHADYRRFRIEGPPAGPRLNVRLDTDPAGGPARLELGGGRRSLPDGPGLAQDATQAIVQAVMERVRDYTVLHAAVLGSEAGALALSGPPGAGKTTLALALLEAGWAYFSDDFCPIHKGTGLAHPFPRSLWVRTGPGANGSRQAAGKRIFPLEDHGFRVETSPRPLKWLVCLGAEDAGPEPLQRFRVHLLEGGEGPFLADLGAIAGSRAERPGGEASREWLVSYPRQPGHTGRAKALLQRHREAIHYAYACHGPGPDFTAQPRLDPMEPMAVAYFLLRELKQAPAQGPGSLPPGALLAHLGDRLADVACFRLSPGPLAQCLALIQAAVQEGVRR
jgi:hypothetical protein